MKEHGRSGTWKRENRRKRDENSLVGVFAKHVAVARDAATKRYFLFLPCVLPFSIPLSLSRFSLIPSVTRLGFDLLFAGRAIISRGSNARRFSPFVSPPAEFPLVRWYPKLSLFSERVQRHPRRERDQRVSQCFSMWMVAEIDSWARSRSLSWSPG